MNYPMKDGQIDPKFLELVAEQNGYFGVNDVNIVLVAAQQVMQRMQPKHDIKVGDEVEHTDWKRPLGTVDRISKSGKRAMVNGSYYTFEKLRVVKEAQHGEG